VEEDVESIVISLLEVMPLTDHPNQVRCTLRRIGCPIIGDDPNAQELQNKILETRRKHLKLVLEHGVATRPMLHQFALTFVYPFKSSGNHDKDGSTHNARGGGTRTAASRSTKARTQKEKKRKKICAFASMDTEMKRLLSTFGWERIVARKFSVEYLRVSLYDKVIPHPDRLTVASYRLTQPYYTIYSPPQPSPGSATTAMRKADSQRDLQKRSSPQCSSSSQQELRRGRLTLFHAMNYLDFESIYRNIFDMEVAVLQDGVHTGEWLPCRVVKVLADGYYNIALEDGDEGMHIHPKYVRTRKIPEATSEKGGVMTIGRRGAATHPDDGDDRAAHLQEDIYGEPIMKTALSSSSSSRKNRRIASVGSDHEKADAAAGSHKTSPKSVARRRRIAPMSLNATAYDQERKLWNQKENPFGSQGDEDDEGNDAYLCVGKM